ncbi:MAG: PDZ domain-containing protein, partial [Actinobacteria bacterium]|nr:PDZ domain-containing protein [Actinomycetota bacterium]
MPSSNDDDGVDEDPDNAVQPFGWWRELGDDLDDESNEKLEPTAPLPLEDRIWRHPSEMALVALGSSSDTDEPQADGNDPAVVRPDARSPQPSTGFRTRHVALVAIAAGFAGACVTAGVLILAMPRTTTITERVVERQLAEPVTRFVASQSGSGIDVATIADLAKPSIVSIEVMNTLGSVVGGGSGVVIRDDGHILTNHHVIAQADAIVVVTNDGHRHQAVLVGSDPLTDIAVLSIGLNGESLRPAVLGSTTSLRVGEPAVAIGSPLRLEGGPSVTVGVISAIGRTLDLPTGERLYDLIQTDAPIAPGSSGGALLDANGALIGITTVIAVSEDGGAGLGFATPIEIAYDVAVDLMTDGVVTHGFLGVSGDDLTSDEASGLGLPGGALVTGVGPGTPAAAAGLEPGDIIIGLDNQVVPSMSWLVVEVRRGEPGETRRLEVQRGDYRLL